jgi:Family of unknown function (DUF5990)
MKVDIPFRVTVADPLPGVLMQIQRGKNELLQPSTTSEEALIFDFDISVDMSGDAPNFLGKYSQGPKQDRFVYVNSGTYAGQKHTIWARRAKLSLMSISKEQIEEVLASPGSRITTSFAGCGRDGGPTCASVKNLVWTVVKQ